ncbi:hypothetical protein [Streptomyces sp. KL116D]|uniref:hypothetical protein n=1 Tax=Streptomyces sp. KL116D TaxID=3045152 RepID=UPI00355644CC
MATVIESRSAADRAAFDKASYVRPIYAIFSAGHPRGSWPAEEEAARLTAAGTPATVRMDRHGDRFLVVPEVAS